jgi:hypothetical protein
MICCRKTLRIRTLHLWKSEICQFQLSSPIPPINNDSILYLIKLFENVSQPLQYDFVGITLTLGELVWGLTSC